MDQRLNEKHLREYSVFNVCGVIITTNHKTDGIFLSPDDRRHFVAWSSCLKEDFTEQYWDEIYAWFDRGGSRHVVAYLRTLDLSGFNAKGPPPKTEAFRAIVDAGRAPEDAELANVLEKLGSPLAVILSDGVQGPTDTLVSSTLKPSSTDEFILGASHRFGGWTVGVDYVRRRLKETLEDAAIDAAVLAYCDANGGEGCGDVFTGFHQYVLINPGSDVNVRLDGDCTIPGQCDVVTLNASDLGYPKAVRKYDAVQLTVDKAFNGFYGFNASYVWTKLRGNFEGAVKSDNNQTDAGLTQDFDQPGFLDGANGELANGRRHAFKIYGHVKPIEWIDIGINARLESPRKFSCIGNYFDENNFAAA